MLPKSFHLLVRPAGLSLLLGLLPHLTVTAQTATGDLAKILEVDRLGQGPYKTLSAAAKAVRPGDTIRIKANTGPYRETLMIRVSGTPDKPVTIEAEGNVITGFDPITQWEEKASVISCRLKAFPCVLAYRGERLVQDAATGKFTKYADLNETKDTLTLKPGTDKAGWEISTRASAVQINDVSYHTYRNVRASGCSNDGFNLHGVGKALVFENIEGFHNLDEGFSSHDGILIELKGGKFWGNDNGIANSYTPKGSGSFDVVSSIITDTDVHDNLGFGISLHDCSAVMKNVRVWHNGLRQIIFNKVQAKCENVTAYTPKPTARQLLSYTDSKDTKRMFTYSQGETLVTGTVREVKDADAP